MVSASRPIDVNAHIREITDEEIARYEANGWVKLATNSAKLTNILGGYGYRPVLLSMAACVEAACSGGRISP